MTKKYHYTKKTGAPTKYKPEYCQQIIEFFSRSPTKSATKTFTTKKGTVIEEPIELPNDIPFIAEFGRSIGVHHSVLDKWAKHYKDFGLALSHAKELQKEFLIKNAVTGRYNSNFSIFTATNITDMRLAKQEIEASGTVSVKVMKFGGEKGQKDKLTDTKG